MRFPIVNAFLRWRAWKKPKYRSSIRTRRKQNRRPKPLLPTKRNSRKIKRTRKLMKRNPYKRREEIKRKLKHATVQTILISAYAWVGYEVVLSALLME